MKIRHIFLIAYMSFIFILSSLSQPPQPEIDIPFFDKWEHIVEYAILGFLVCHSFYPMLNEGIDKYFSAVLCMSVAVLYGLSDEIHQLFIPGRHSDAVDLFADMAGSFAGTSVYILTRMLTDKKTARGKRRQ